MVAAGGLFLAVDLAAWHVGIGLTKLANASLFGNASSFVLVLYGFVMLRRLPRAVQAAALLLAAIGTALLMGSSYELSPENFTGDLFALAAGLLYTGYLIAVDRARKTMAPMPVLAIATAAGALPLLLLSLALGQKVMPDDWTPLIILSFGSQVVGQGLLVYAVGYLSPVVVGLGLLAQPAAGAVIGRFAYGETFSLADAAGAALIAVGAGPDPASGEEARLSLQGRGRGPLKREGEGLYGLRADIPSTSHRSRRAPPSPLQGEGCPCILPP